MLDPFNLNTFFYNEKNLNKKSLTFDSILLYHVTIDSKHMTCILKPVVRDTCRKSDLLMLWGSGYIQEIRFQWCFIVSSSFLLISQVV